MLISTKLKHKVLRDKSGLKVRDNKLKAVQKYLGEQIENSLDLKKHIKTVSSKDSRAIGF